MKYTFLTGLLTLAYVAFVILTVQVLALQTPLAVGATTVVAALLFKLPRRRLQRTVNRRYHRPA
jgi:hypothetical protein